MRCKCGESDLKLTRGRKTDAYILTCPKCKNKATVSEYFVNRVLAKDKHIRLMLSDMIRR